MKKQTDNGPDTPIIIHEFTSKAIHQNVLAGARNSLDRIVGMRIEMSIVKSYEGEPLMCEMLPFLGELGFRLCSVENAWSNEKTQELYQIDGVLFRTGRL
jgi:hypothetical protein